MKPRVWGLKPLDQWWRGEREEYHAVDERVQSRYLARERSERRTMNENVRGCRLVIKKLELIELSKDCEVKEIDIFFSNLQRELQGGVKTIWEMKEGVEWNFRSSSFFPHSHSLTHSLLLGFQTFQASYSWILTRPRFLSLLLPIRFFKNPAYFLFLILLSVLFHSSFLCPCSSIFTLISISLAHSPSFGFLSINPHILFNFYSCWLDFSIFVHPFA